MLCANIVKLTQYCYRKNNINLLCEELNHAYMHGTTTNYNVFSMANLRELDDERHLSQLHSGGIRKAHG